MMDGRTDAAVRPIMLLSLGMLKSHPGLLHGMPTTRADFLEFIRG